MRGRREQMGAVSSPPSSGQTSTSLAHPKQRNGCCLLGRNLRSVMELTDDSWQLSFLMVPPFQVVLERRTPVGVEFVRTVSV